MSTIQLSNNHLFNHGCGNYAVAINNGDGTATIQKVQSCTSCWQVGHDSGYEYFRIGQTVSIASLLDDVIPESELRSE